MNRLALILLCLAALAAPSTLAQTTTLLEAGAFAAGPILHDGRVVSLRTAPGGGTRLVRLDPATGRTAETPLPAPGGRLSYGKLLSLAGRLYVQTSDDVSYEDGPLFALDGPAFAPAPADPRLASIDPYELGQSSGERAFAPLAADGDADGEAKALSEIGADGRVTPLEAPATGGRYYPTPVGDAVYYVVERPDGQDYSYTLWRASGGRATAADVLPAGAGTVSGLAAAGDTLIIAAADGERGPTRLYRLAPGAARATPVPGFETPNGFSQSVFRTVGDVLFFTVATSNDSGADSGGRVRLYRQRGTSAPAQVPNLDLGGEATFFASSARTFDGALYVASYTPSDEDPYGTKRSLFRVGPDGVPQLAVRVESDGSSPRLTDSDSEFVVAGGKLYFVLQVDGDLTLASVPLAGQAPVRTQRRGRRR